MEISEIIGWGATAVTMISFTLNRMLYLRIVNISACIIWIVFGIIKKENPIIATNAMIALIHIFWFLKQRRAAGEKVG
jgi:hypothetical protein